jgi:hypothetical protein
MIISMFLIEIKFLTFSFLVVRNVGGKGDSSLLLSVTLSSTHTSSHHTSPILFHNHSFLTLFWKAVV